MAKFKIFLYYLLVLGSSSAVANEGAGKAMEASTAVVFPKEIGFVYVQFSTFTAELENGPIGMGFGYRHPLNSFISGDLNLHVITNIDNNINIAGKARQIFYLTSNQESFSPYMGFGIICGISCYEEQFKFVTREKGIKETVGLMKSDYSLFLNGEIVLGCELQLNETTKQFLELTYSPQSNALLLSLGLGF